MDDIIIIKCWYSHSYLQNIFNIRLINLKNLCYSIFENLLVFTHDSTQLLNHDAINLYTTLINPLYYYLPKITLIFTNLRIII